MTLINIALGLVVIATTFSLITQPEKLTLDGTNAFIAQWLRLQFYRMFVATIVAVLCVVALVLLNLPRAS